LAGLGFEPERVTAIRRSRTKSEVRQTPFGKKRKRAQDK
jgi:hypothetical protein